MTKTKAENRSLVDRLFSDGWLSPNTYSNFYSSIPDAPGVYLFLARDIYREKDDLVLYVGMSMRLAQRHKQHEIMRELKKLPKFIMVFFKELDAKLIRKEEKNLIELFNPPFNIIGRKRGI